MDDAQLVEAAFDGDRNAIAAIYDRYANRMHDFVASILRNRAEAADALQETFLVAFGALHRLAEPDRLRAWLYALAHRSVLDRVDHYGPAFFADDGELSVAGSGDERLSRAELAEFVWQAAGGLDIADRVLLDLHLRQGLEGRELASAAGVSGLQLDNHVARLESQVSRSLGALVVARTGRRSCPDLFSILSGHDPRLTPELRSEITTHVDECERCNPRRRIAPDALGLLAATPPAPAPAYLRGVVLGKAELSDVEREGASGREGLLARTGWAFQRDGFPALATGGASGGAAGGDGGWAARPATGPVFASTRRTVAAADVDTDPRGTPTVVLASGGGRGAAPPASGFGPDRGPGRGPGRHDRLGMLIGAVAGVIILIVAAVVLLPSHPKKTGGVIAVTASTTTTAGTTPSTTAPTAVFSIPTTTVPATTVLATGHLIVGAKMIDFGVAMNTTSVQFGNDGAAPLDFTAVATSSGLSVNPVAGTLAPGASQILVVSLDRTASPPGPFSGSIQLSSQGGSTSIHVTAIVDPGPMITNPAEAPSVINPTPRCMPHTTPTRPPTSTITATVSASQPLSVVVLHSRSLGSATEDTPIQMAMSGTVYTATLGPYPMATTIDWWITAVDSAKVAGMSTHGSLSVLCP